ncbi:MULTISPECIES: hypothetical protein [Rufibacter]|uniref:Uncharacterized protein n=1 Tax=Rufibacter quisquiliarum TaxID=1549639 RepID=A0A839GTD4_9BACT|nr:MULTISPECIES: hypothetical protein [Rufibacter]MBA9078137.1 hypothetical protein [Rufibacter quisquiliarum]
MNWLETKFFVPAVRRQIPCKMAFLAVAGERMAAAQRGSFLFLSCFSENRLKTETQSLRKR